MNFEINEYHQEITRHVTNQLPFAIHGGQLSQNNNDQIMPHWHEEFQFVWIFSGELIYQIEEKTLLLNESEGLFINSKILHSATPQTTAEYMCINFSPQFINAEVYASAIQPIVEQTDFCYEKLYLSSLQKQFLKELANDTPEFSLLKLYAFLLEILSQLHPSTQQQIATSKVIYQLLEYVHQHAFEPLTVAQIAASCGINKNKCTALFKQYTALSPINYLIAYRLEQAREQLEHTDWSISEIAEFVGFHQLSYFITKFKARFHQTPLQYRKKQSEKEK